MKKSHTLLLSLESLAFGGLVQKPREKSEMFVRRKFQDVKEPKFKTLSHSLCVDSVQ